MNGFMHGSQGIQTRPNQAEFLGNGTAADGHDLMLSSSATANSQQGSSFGYNSGHVRSSDRPEFAEAPVSFDFLGGHQQLTRSQHPGISQTHLRPQPGSNDMHLLQQQLMVRQLQEIQRQQQLQQLGQGGRQQNQIDRSSGTEKQLAGVQLPAMLSGIPIHNASNPMWSNEFMECDVKIPSSSQIILAGNKNWAQHSVSPSIHGSAMQAMGTVPQQQDHSLYGTPVINARGSLNYPQFPGMSLECTNVVTKAGGNQAEKADAISFQNAALQGKYLFGNTPVRDLNDTVPSENVQQVNHLVQNAQVQGSQDRQEQADWSDSLQFKPGQQVGFSHGVTNLDIKEAKLLFGTDDYNNWNSNMSTEGYLHGNTLEGHDYCGGFSSIQSGSWSALMQEALGASSSDTGVQEEWGGLSVAKPEVPTRNNSAEFDVNTKQHMTWDSNKTQATSTSSAFPLFNDGEKGSTCLSSPNFQQSTKFACQQDGVQNDASRESFRQPAVEDKQKQLDHSHKQKQFEGTSLPFQAHFGNVSNGVWTGQMHHQALNNAAGMELNMQNVQGFWAQHQKFPLQNVISHTSKPNSWNINEPQPHSGPNSLKANDDDGMIQDAQRYDITRDAHMKHDLNASLKNSNTQKVYQPVVSRHQDALGKNVAADSSVHHKGVQEPNRVVQAFDSSLNIIEKQSCETDNVKQENNQGCMYNFSHTSQYTGSRTDASKSSMLAGNEPSTSISGGQKSSGQSDQKTLGPQRLQYHPFGNTEINIESASPHIHKSHSQGPSQLFAHGLKSREQGYAGTSQFVGDIVKNNLVDMEKSYSTELQKDARGTNKMQSVGAIRSHDSAATASFDGSSPHYDQSRRVGQPSQNMLELLHKVDQSRNINPHTRFSSCPQFSQNPFQGVGLGLAPPAQAGQGSNHTSALQNSMQTSDESASRHTDTEAGNRDQTLSPSLSHQSSQREDSNSTNTSGQARKMASRSSMQANPNLASSTPNDRNQQHHQLHHVSRATGFAKKGQSGNFPIENLVDANEHLKQAAYFRQTHESHDGIVAEQSAQASFAGVSGRVFPSRLASAVANSQAPRSQFYSLNTGFSRPTSSIASHLSTGSQFPVMDPLSVSQSSALSGIPQEAGFSTRLPNVWTNVSAQHQPSGVQPQRTISNLFHPMNQLSTGMVTGPWLPQKADDKSNRVSSSDLANSEQVTFGEERRVKDNSLQQLPPEGVHGYLRTSNGPQGQKLLRKQISDGNSVLPIPSLIHSQQEHGQGKHKQESLLNSQPEYATVHGVDSPNHGAGTYGADRKQSDTQTQNYSLLQQMQAMKGAGPDLSERVGKRIGGADSGSDSSQIDWKTGQRYVYSHNSVSGLSVDGELGTSSQQSSLPSGVKMLSFSRENGEKSANASSQLIAREANSQNILASAQHDLQSQIHSLCTASTSTSTGGTEHPQISPHMAPTWFKQYGNYQNGQILAIYDGPGGSQHNAKAAAQHYLFGKAFENKFGNVAGKKRDDAIQAMNIQQSTSSAIAVVKSSLCPPLDNMDNDTALKSKKRRSPTSELLPWHKEVANASRKLQIVSMDEIKWAQATNRLVEKVKDETEMIEDGPALPRPKRRLILTTQLMQQLFPPAPARFLRENASSSYESVTYFAARSALGDACSMVCCSGSDCHLPSAAENVKSESHKTSERKGDRILSKVVEGFIGRSRKLESDFLRLDRRLSLLEVRMECQDLERCSIINRFAKFHGRAQTEGVEISSTSQTVTRRIFPQRQVAALPVPGDPPEGVLCLSL